MLSKEDYSDEMKWESGSLIIPSGSFCGLDDTIVVIEILPSDPDFDPGVGVRLSRFLRQNLKLRTGQAIVAGSHDVVAKSKICKKNAGKKLEKWP